MLIKQIAPRDGTIVIYDRQRYPDNPINGEIPARIEVSPQVFAFRNGHEYIARFPYDADANTIIRNVSGAHFDRQCGWHCRPVFAQDLIEALQDIADIIQPDMTGFAGDRAAARAAAVEAVTLRRQERTRAEAAAHGERLAAARAARAAAEEDAKNTRPDAEPDFSL